MAHCCVICLRSCHKFFARIPKNKERCKKWLKMIGNKELLSFPIKKLNRKKVCGDHFENDAFNRQGNRLKKSALPTLKLKLAPLTKEELAGFPRNDTTDDAEASTSQPLVTPGSKTKSCLKTKRTEDVDTLGSAPAKVSRIATDVSPATEEYIERKDLQSIYTKKLLIKKELPHSNVFSLNLTRTIKIEPADVGEDVVSLDPSSTVASELEVTTDVKQEMDIGPVVLQPPDVRFTPRLLHKPMDSPAYGSPAEVVSTFVVVPAEFDQTYVRAAATSQLGRSTKTDGPAGRKSSVPKQKISATTAETSAAAGSMSISRGLSGSPLSSLSDSEFSDSAPDQFDQNDFAAIGSESGDDFAFNEDKLARNHNIALDLMSDGRAVKDRALRDAVTEDLGFNSDDDVLMHRDPLDDVPPLRWFAEEFTWSEDYSKFEGRKEVFDGVSGATTPCTSPLQCFLNTWDEDIMTHIVTETNRYAEKYLSNFLDKNPLKKLSYRINQWKPATLDEMYILFAIFIEQSTFPIDNQREYWYPKGNSNPAFAHIMKYHRFMLLMKFLYFSNCDDAVKPYPNDVASSFEARLFKIQPVVDHCRRKFREQYTPQQEISIDLSLMLWTGKCGFHQNIRTKTAKSGIKTFELCETNTGYLYDFYLHTGTTLPLSQEEIREYGAWSTSRTTDVIIIRLIAPLLNKGHVLFMDNYCNSPVLARFLKRHRTDCVGTVKCNRASVPSEIKNRTAHEMMLNEYIERHSKDVSVISWKEVKRKVTMLSTYHPSNDSLASHGLVMKPDIIRVYNNRMVELKDQRLAAFPLERIQEPKWHRKWFKNTLNVSILNSYIVYCDSIEKLGTSPNMKVLNHRDFRYAICKGLVQLFQRSEIYRARPVGPSRQVIIGFHRIGYNLKDKRKVCRGCVVCRLRGKETRIRFCCSECKVALCVPQCFNDYHTLKTLTV